MAWSMSDTETPARGVPTVAWPVTVTVERSASVTDPASFAATVAVRAWARGEPLGA
jgi:hypothetical protein